MPPARLAVQTAGQEGGYALNVVYLSVAVVLACLSIAWGVRRRDARRARAVRELLDAADALEARLRTARGEIEAIAGDGGDGPIREALKEMLRQRLWLREHGGRASLGDLARVRESIDAARARIDQQLARLDHARAG